jgi:hypothetical protein
MKAGQVSSFLREMMLLLLLFKHSCYFLSFPFAFPFSPFYFLLFFFFFPFLPRSFWAAGAALRRAANAPYARATAR